MGLKMRAREEGGGLKGRGGDLQEGRRGQRKGVLGGGGRRGSEERESKGGKAVGAEEGILKALKAENRGGF